MKKIKISAAVATFNEENNIVDCLESLKQFVDEIIVVDGESQDKTRDLARKLGVKVYKVSNKAMFHINKNIAVRKCSYDWIIVIDADERISKELAKEITNVVNSDPKENGFWINRRNWFLGGYLKKGGAYPDPVIRLFRKGRGIHPEITVHEQIKIEGEVGHLKNDILHLADPSFSRYLERANRYTDETSTSFKMNKTSKNALFIFYYMLIKPFISFLNIYIRHAGFKDGYRGFVWALFSSFHHYYAYAKYLTNRD